MILFFLSTLIVVCLNYLFYNYVSKLEKSECACSENWKRDFIKYYSLFVLVYIGVLMALVFGSIFTKNMLDVKLIGPIAMLIQILGFVYLYCLYTYSRELIDGNCECSDMYERKLMYDYTMVIVYLYVFIFIANIGVAGFVYSKDFEKLCKSRFKSLNKK